MKKEGLLKIGLSFLIVLLCTACNMQDIFTDSESGSGQAEYVGSRSGLSFDYYSESNPTLQTDWENVEVIKLNGGLEIDAPWVYKEGNSMNIPFDYRMDIKKEDGWKLLSHTMIKQTSTEPNYLIFYNKYRGQIKGFYYSPTNIPNNSFVWTLESATPTTIIPSNTRIQGPLNSSLSTVITTSNIVNNSSFNFEHLNQGWNAFSYELIYGSVNNNPIVRFSGYNSQISALAMNGTYSGEVIVPTVVKSDPLAGATNIFSTLSKVAGFVGTFIPVAKTISGALSVVSSVLGGASAYMSKSETVNVRLNSSGTIALTGNSITPLGSIVTSTDNIDLKRINNGQPLGLWNLKKNPEFTYNKYQIIMCDYTAFSGHVQCTLKEDLNSLIEINPEVRSSIKNYTLIGTQFFTENPTYYPYLSEKVADGCYFTNFYFTQYGQFNPNPEDLSRYDVCYVHPYCSINSAQSIFVNMTISFEFNDGSTFISSRNFKANMIQIDNKSEIDWLQSSGPDVKIIYIY